QASPGRCETVQLLYDIAHRDGSTQEQERRAQDLGACGDGLRSLAQLARERGELGRAEDLLALGARLRPAVPQRLEQLAEVQVARKELDKAIASVQQAAALAPRSSEPWRRLAGLFDLQGNAAAAAEARRAALRLAPGDLGLRQQVWLGRGEKLLGWSDR